MASHLDLEEQEQLDQLKHFWNTVRQPDHLGADRRVRRHRRLERLAVLAAHAGRPRPSRCTTRSSAPRRPATLARAERAFADMQATSSAARCSRSRPACSRPRSLADKGKPDAAKAALAWVADKSSDEGYQAIARLRLAGAAGGSQGVRRSAQAARSRRSPQEFEALVADRRGDIYNLQGKKDQAQAEYRRPTRRWTSAPTTAAWSRSSSPRWASTEAARGRRAGAPREREVMTRRVRIAGRARRRRAAAGAGRLLDAVVAVPVRQRRQAQARRTAAQSRTAGRAPGVDRQRRRGRASRSPST